MKFHDNIQSLYMYGYNLQTTVQDNIFQPMEIVGQEMKIELKCCMDCVKKQQLIDKYGNLITLLKKKADRSQASQLSVSNKQSVGDRTTSHTSFNAFDKSNRYILPILLNKLEMSLNYTVFYQIRSQSCYKNCKKCDKFMSKINKVRMNKARQFFDILRYNQSDDINENILVSQSGMQGNILNQQQQSRTRMAVKQHQKSQCSNHSPTEKKSFFSQQHNFTAINHTNYKSLVLVHEELITSLSQTQPRTVKQCSFPFQFTRKQPSPSSHKIRNVYKKLFSLQQENSSFQLKIKKLQKDMQQALNRQVKQNNKKTQSLQMVAQEMTQKNQLISQLQQKITMLQERYGCETNGVLEDQLTQYRKQVEKLDKVNIRLDNDLRRTREKLAQVEAGWKIADQCKGKLDMQNTKIKQALFLMEQKVLTLQAKQQNFKISCSKIERILEKLRFQQKRLSKTLNQSKQVNHQPLPSQVLQGKQLEQFYRLQLVFIYLYNIQDESYDFGQHEHVFDEEQLEVLKQLRAKFREMKETLDKKVHFMQNIEHGGFGVKQNKFMSTEVRLSGENQNQNQKGEDDMYGHHDMMNGSIFEILNQKRQDKTIIEFTPQATQRLSPQKNLTMKLLQMQIEKNKQIQKISQLKQKSMYVRNIILNLMRSLELKQNSLKIQTSGILDLILDVFQYSEEEKQIIFSHMNQQTKQKRFFGFI